MAQSLRLAWSGGQFTRGQSTDPLDKPLFAVANALLFVSAPLAHAHQGNNEHDTDRQENQRPLATRRGCTTGTMRQRWQNQHSDFPNSACRDAIANTEFIPRAPRSAPSAIHIAKTDYGILPGGAYKF